MQPPWQLLLSLVGGLILGWVLAIYFLKAEQQARSDAMRLCVGLLLLGAYLVAILARAFGFSQWEPPMMLALMVAAVTVFVFPRSMIKYSKDGGFEVGTSSSQDPSNKEVTPRQKPCPPQGSDSP